MLNSTKSSLKTEALNWKCDTDYQQNLIENVKALRVKVFVEEQGFPLETEFDNHEDESLHVALIHDDEDEEHGQTRSKNNPTFIPSQNELSCNSIVIGCCRLRSVNSFVKLERVAILRDFRNKGLGIYLIKKARNIASISWPGKILVAHAQTQTIPFYQKLGALTVGPEFDEEGVSHRSIAFIEYIKNYSQYIPPLYNQTEYLDFGEINHTDVLNKINSIQKDVQNGIIISPLDLFNVINKSEDELGLHWPLLQRVIPLVCSLEAHIRQDYGTEISRILNELSRLAMHKINVGHYDKVLLSWRKLKFLVDLAESIRHFPNYYIPEENVNPLDALRFLDNGLIMGGNFLYPQFIINRSKVLKEFLPILEFIEPPMIPVQFPPPLPNSIQIEIIEPIPEEIFYEQYILPQKAVLIKGAAQIKAVGKWSLKYLSNILSWRSFPVETGSSYTVNDWRQSIMLANDFFQQIENPDKLKGPVYLAQHRLLEQIPELHNDVIIPPYCNFTNDKEDVEINVWFGPVGTVSPLHTDPKDNIFCQTYGSKFFRLVPPEFSSKLYLAESGIHKNTSQVDVENPNFDCHSLFREVLCFDAHVEAGDLLYIPKQWFHHVRSLSPSTSLSFWF